MAARPSQDGATNPKPRRVAFLTRKPYGGSRQLSPSAGSTPPRSDPLHRRPRSLFSPPDTREQPKPYTGKGERRSPASSPGPPGHGRSRTAQPRGRGKRGVRSGPRGRGCTPPRSLGPRGSLLPPGARWRRGGGGHTTGNAAPGPAAAPLPRRPHTAAPGPRRPPRSEGRLFGLGGRGYTDSPPPQ